jgi:hypothetical protein
MSMTLNINDSDIDAQAIEIFSTDRIRCVATNDKVAKRIEELSEIERTAFIEKVINHLSRYLPTAPGRSAISVGELMLYDSSTREWLSLPHGVYYKYETEIIRVPGGGRFGIFKLLKFGILDKPLSLKKRNKLERMFSRW